MSRFFLIICLALAAAALGGCAMMDGGIDGTGNRVDCEKARQPLPPECRREGTSRSPGSY